MTNHSAGSPDQIEPSHDCYRVEFSTRAYAESSIDTLNICDRTQSAIACFDENVKRDAVCDALSTVLAPAEHRGVTAAGKLDTVTVLETDPLVVEISLGIDC